MTEHRRREDNSSCALFLAIMFVLMLFGNTHKPNPKDSSYSGGSTSYGGNNNDFFFAHSTTPPSGLVDGFNWTSSGYPSFYNSTSYQHPPTRFKARKSSGVVVMLFAGLMLVQVAGFCFVIAMRRRRARLLMQNDILPSSIQRSASGWEVEYESDDNDIDNHPAIGSINNANGTRSGATSNGDQSDLPSYEEALRTDPNLPDYHAQSQPPLSQQPLASVDVVVDAPQARNNTDSNQNNNDNNTNNNNDDSAVEVQSLVIGSAPTDDLDFSDFSDSDNDNEPLLASHP